MKKIITLLALLFCLNAKAQWVTIPDTHFAAYLQSIIPGAMNGNQMDTTNALVTTTTHSIIARSNGNPNNIILNLFGVQYFTSLTYLDCSTNYIGSLPALPNTLTYLNCSSNNLASLPTLPNTLTYLDCSSNNLASLPTLSNTLTVLNCTSNQFTNLPTLPNSLQRLSCGFNSFLTNLPALPNSLQLLECSNEPLTSLPALPNSLQYLTCNNDSLTSLPVLPNSLQYLYCQYNLLTSLPALPNLYNLYCQYNSLTGLPALPNSLNTLYCQNNNIECFPAFPNPSQITTNSYFTIDPNPYNCLPNYIGAMNSAQLATPLCAAGNSNGCAIATGINQIADLNNQINIYPNPTNINFIIETNTTDKQTLQIFDVNGKIVLNQTITGKTNIDVTNLAEGVYNLCLINLSEVVNKRLVIVK